MPFEGKGLITRRKHHPIVGVDEEFVNTKVWFNGQFILAKDLIKIKVQEKDTIKKDNAIYVSAILDVLFRIDVPLTNKDLALLLKGTITTKTSQAMIYDIVRHVIKFLVSKGIVQAVPLKAEGRKTFNYLFLTEYGKQNVEKLIIDLQKDERSIDKIFENGEKVEQKTKE